MWVDYCTIWVGYCTMWVDYCNMWVEYRTMWFDHCTCILSLLQMLAGHSICVNTYHVRGLPGDPAIFQEHALPISLFLPTSIVCINISIRR